MDSITIIIFLLGWLAAAVPALILAVIRYLKHEIAGTITVVYDSSKKDISSIFMEFENEQDMYKLLGKDEVTVKVKNISQNLQSL